MTTLSQLFDLPQQITDSSFVVNLADADAHLDQLVDQYVITEQLAQSFGQALHLIREAVDNDDAVASYLHGSFGSGKSHFMAVLYGLLQRHPAALSKPGLEGVVQEFNPWLRDKSFLLVPFHMIGAASIEQKLLGGYVDHITRLHPDAPKPMVYKGETLFADAARMRDTLGDETFFAKLNEGGDDGGDWGDGDDWGMGSAWNAETYELAVEAPAGDPARLQLMNALIDTYFESYRSVVQDTREAFVDLDLGLSIITHHAADLGYDALVLFIDEIILWLASRVSEPGFLEREGQKLSKLVEGQHDKALPLISFMARQKSLREFAGDQLLGSDQVRAEMQIEHWDSRFGKISLEDRNLPEIVAQRLLRPSSADAKAIVDEDFQKTLRVQQEVRDHLQTDEFDLDHFRKLYPFSPALVQALVAVSSLLQRERTALKVLAELLVQRSDMELGGVIPVGEVWDRIAAGAAPFAGDANAMFERTKKLYEQKLLPLIESEAGLTREAYERGEGDPGTRFRFEGSERLVKTLLLAALAPHSPALADLTPHKLVALNHGSIRHPIPGQEAQEVLKRCKTWATQGPLRVSTGDVPTVSIVVGGVDLDPIIDKVGAVDTHGSRLRLLREVLYEELGIRSSGEIFDGIEFEHKGVKREFEVLFQNVRELSDDSLRTTGDGRRIVIDFPFDNPGQGADDDRLRLERFRQSEPPARTLVWLPSFLSDGAQRDLGRLVRIEHLLTGDRLETEADTLSPTDRAMARQNLKNQRDQLRDRLKTILLGAYGAGTAVDGTLSETNRVDEHWYSLDNGTQIRPPAAGSLGTALQELMTQVLDAQYPAHPDFGHSITPSVLRKVWSVCHAALEDPDHRVLVDKPLRPLVRQVAVPAELGTMGETHFVLGTYWYDRLSKKGAQAAVGDLRAAIDEPQPRGLPPAVETVVLMVYAAQADSTFQLRGGPYDPAIDKRIPSEVTLAKVDLPTDDEFQRARGLVGSMFGVTVSRLCNATNVSDLVAKVESAIRQHDTACRTLAGKLDQVLTRLGLDPATCERSVTAHAVVAMLEHLQGHRDADFVRALLEVRVKTSAEAMGTSLKQAESLVREIDGANWTILTSLLTYDGPKKQEAIEVVDRLRTVMRSDEYAQPMMPELKTLEERATGIVVGAKPPPPVPSGKVLAEGTTQAASPTSAAEALDALRAALEEHGDHPDARVDLIWKIYTPGKGPS